MLLRKARVRGIQAAAGGVRGLEPRPFPSSDYLRLWPDFPQNIPLEPVVVLCHTPLLPEGKWHMAPKPLQDDPSGPETESSQSERIHDLEPVLVLRTAKSLILPLLIPDQWEEQPVASAPPTRSTEAFPIMPFKATTQVFDPGTQRPHTLTVSIEPSIDDDANVFLQSDSIRS